MNKKTTYSEAVLELEAIIADVESGELDIDEITKKLKEAKKLFEFCKTKLNSTKQTIDNLLEDE